MTRRTGWKLAVALALVAMAVPAMAGDSEVSVLLGGKGLTEDRLDDAGVNTGFQYGVRSTIDFGWPVALAFDLLAASDDATKNFSGGFPLSIKTETDTLEFHFGVRRYLFEDQPVRPYVGGGLSMAQLKVRQVESGSFGPGTEYSNVVVDDKDSGVGYWLGGGFGYFVKQLVIGADVQWSNASADIGSNGGNGSVGLDSGGIQLGAFVGYKW